MTFDQMTTAIMASLNDDDRNFFMAFENGDLDWKLFPREMPANSPWPAVEVT
jgi:hypothetical protein